MMCDNGHHPHVLVATPSPRIECCCGRTFPIHGVDHTIPMVFSSGWMAHDAVTNHGHCPCLRVVAPV